MTRWRCSSLPRESCMPVVLLRCAVLLRCVVLLRLRAPAALHGIIFFLHGRSLPLQLISPLASPLHCSSSRFESPPYLPHFPLLPRRSIMPCPAGGSMSASRFVHSPVAPTANPSNDMVGNFAFYTARCLQHTTNKPPSPPPPRTPRSCLFGPLLLASVWRASSAACLQLPLLTSNIILASARGAPINVVTGEEISGMCPQTPHSAAVWGVGGGAAPHQAPTCASRLGSSWPLTSHGEGAQHYSSFENTPNVTRPFLIGRPLLVGPS